MADKEKKPQWFKVWGLNYSVISALDSKTVGDALKAALKYFVSGLKDDSCFDELNKDDASRIALSIFVNAVDDAFTEYKESIENGRLGFEKKVQKIREEEKKKLEQERQIAEKKDYPDDNLPF